MKRIKDYFVNARTCQKYPRHIGTEIETLIISIKDDQPISQKISKKIMRRLVDEHGYTINEEENGLITKIGKNGYELFYELGWNNFEIISPAYPIENVDAMFSRNDKRLQELESVCQYFGAKIIDTSWDNDLSNTLIMPDKRDEIWLKLDGQSLYGLGHIASIHLNIDLASIDEGMEWIEKLNRYFKQVQWPPEKNRTIWEAYLKYSFANYEEDRYAQPPETFVEYCQKLSEYKVVMNRVNGELEIARPAQTFAETENVDLNLFLRSIWWWSRLRVRNGKLVLEIRDIPRTLGDKKAYSIVKEILSL